MSAIAMVLLAARACEGAGEQPPNSNAGPFVERCQRSTGNRKGDAWCASFTTMCGVLALGDAWPVVRSGRVQVISDWAKAKGCRFRPEAGAQVGDLFVIWYEKLQRHAHIGYVVEVMPDGRIRTCEGNTSMPGDNDPARAREGWVVASKTRTLSPKDRLVRWAPLVSA